MLGIHIKTFNDAQWEVAKKALSDAGHIMVTDTVDNVHVFTTKLEADFPDVYAAIKKGVADAKDSTKSGGERAVAVAMDALAIAPTVISSLPGIKDAMVSAVTNFFAKEVSDFKSVTIDTITKL